MKAEAMALGEFGKELKKMKTVTAVAVNWAAFDAACGHMIPSAGMDDSWRARHGLEKRERARMSIVDCCVMTPIDRLLIVD
jgi:hypothetical protein